MTRWTEKKLDQALDQFYDDDERPGQILRTLTTLREREKELEAALTGAAVSRKEIDHAIELGNRWREERAKEHNNRLSEIEEARRDLQRALDAARNTAASLEMRAMEIEKGVTALREDLGERLKVVESRTASLQKEATGRDQRIDEVDELSKALKQRLRRVTDDLQPLSNSVSELRGGLVDLREIVHEGFGYLSGMPFLIGKAFFKRFG